MDIRGKAHKTLLELAKAEGLRTGDVTTAEIEDATPAVLVSHVTARSCYGPVVTSTTCPTDALENGGRGSIAEQLLRTRPDVTLGGGAATFKETAEAGGYQGRTLLRQADQRGYRVVTTASGLAAVNQANRKRPVLGAVQRRQPPGAVAGPAAGPAGAQAKAARCTPNPEHTAATPGLPTMTTKAIQLLDDKRSDKGFLLQVEGASIDKRDHAADACGQIA